MKQMRFGLPAGRGLSRRSLLGSLGLGAAAMPLLPCLDARAASPLRLLIITVQDSPASDSFWPTGGERDFVIKPGLESALSPVADYRDRMLVLGGTRLENLGELKDAAGIPAHQSRPFLMSSYPGARTTAVDWDKFQYGVSGPSIDQFIATELARQGQRTPIESLICAMGSPKSYSGLSSTLTGVVNGKINAVGSESSPAALFERLFRGVAPAMGGGAEQRRAQIRRAVIEQVRGATAALGPRLAREDRDALEQYHVFLKGLQADLDRPAPQASASCARIEKPAAGLVAEAKIKAFSDLVTMAFACDLTRVASIHWDGGIQFQFDADRAAATDKGGQDEHGIVHDNSDASRKKKRQIDYTYSTYLKYTLDRLASIKFGTESLLDRTVVLFTGEMADGFWHSTNDFKMALFGAGDGAFKTGRYVRWASGVEKKIVSHQGVLRALAEAMGVTAPYGDPRYGGTLSVLRG